ncbi:MAG: LrgB family protein [Lachnospira sp.]|nr:LrgB family protein [Lachnospira sp.]
MRELLTDSVYFGVMISLSTYGLGVLLKKRFRLAIFNPLLIAVAATIVLLLTFHIDYESYYEGAKYISYLLTPATVCLAIPLYEQLSLLKSNYRAILLGILSGVLTSAVSVLAFTLLFHFDHNMYVTMLPKSITMAIGMGITEELNGYVTITVAMIIITGIFGNMISEWLLRCFRITDPVAKGIAIGTSSHAMGTAKAMEMGEIEGAMSSLAIAVAGLLTVFAAIIFSWIW